MIERKEDGDRESDVMKRKRRIRDRELGEKEVEEQRGQRK